MNRFFRLVWNAALELWVPAAENAKGRGKTGRARTACAATVGLSLLLVPSVHAAPGGGKVVSGMGSITQSGNITDVHQGTQNLSIDWQSFDVAPQETVNFIQPSASAIAINRIFDVNGSQILGHLNANGQVYLINPNGILFGKGATVDVGGLVASTLDLDDASFVGSAKSFSGAGIGSITNLGSIAAAGGGYVALLGNHVSNQGLIAARLGMVALAGGSAVTLTFDGNSLVHLQVDRSVLGSLASNGGIVQADGGEVVMTAGARDALLASVVNNTGVIEARTVENHGGTITLLGGMGAGTVNVAGALDASAPEAGAGGRIETSAAHVEVAGGARVTTAAAKGLFGSWLIDPQDFTVAASGGDITGTALSGELGSTSVTLQSSSGHAAGSGNVNVNAAVSWSADTTLTLTASNAVNVNAAVTATGKTAGVFINTPGAAELPGSYPTSFTLGAAGIINLPNVSPTSKTALVIGGTPYTVINSLGSAGSVTGTDLQGINGNLAGLYALGSNVNASPTVAWNGGSGFTPLGTSMTPFTGTLEGLGHTVSQLVIDRPTMNDVGLVGYAAANSVIRDMGLIGGSVSGATYVGGLVGLAGGAVVNSYAMGNVSGSNYVGGLVGAVGGQTYGTVTSSYATGNVTGKTNVGGLAGVNTGNSYPFSGGYIPQGMINESYATGNVVGSANVGGLVGGNEGLVQGSFATGSINGGSAVGGLVGANTRIISADDTFYSGITDSYATGRVSGVAKVGGLVGVNGVNGSTYQGTLSGSHATGTVGATGNDVGGLVGLNYGEVSGSYATGKVSGANSVGGLLGSSNFTDAEPFSGGTTANYATGNVSGVSSVGGLVGSTASMQISRSHATGTVTGSGNDVGGLVGSVGYGETMTAYPVQESYATGKVTGVNNVGGLVGYVGYIGVGGLTGSAALLDNYATGSVNGHGSVGGLVGYEEVNLPSNSVTVIDSYSVGHVSGVTGVGGLIGTSANVVSDSYWNTATSGQTTSAGGTPLTAAQMQSIANFAGFQAGNSVNAAWVMIDANGTLNNAGGAAGAVLPMLISEYSTTVTNAHQLQLMAMDPTASYTLAQNIAASATGGGGDVWGTPGFVPVGNATTAFTGRFDGLGHDVANLTLDQPAANAIGLFGVTGKTGVVQNVGLTNAVVNGAQLVGPLVGVNGGSVTNGYATGTAVGTGNVGGLVGENSGSLSNDRASTIVDAPRAVGGLVGWNEAGLVEDSYATGGVTGSNTVGGLVGLNGPGAAATLDYASGHVVGSSAVGGLVGLSTGGTVSDSYWNVTTSGRAASAGGTGLTAVQMQTASNFIGFHFTTTPGLAGNNWVIVDVDGTLNNAGGAAGATSPLLASEYSTSIDDSHQLQLIAMNLSASYTLQNSLDLSATGAGGDVWSGAGFAPLGTIDSPFRGRFDGSAETIGNLTILQPSATDVGLFGHTSTTAAVSNLGLVDSRVAGSQDVGALIGLNAGVVNGSFATGAVSGSNNAGGLVGANAGSIDNSYATSSVTAARSVGGLVGYDTGKLVDNYSAGRVSGSNTSTLGGLVGINGAPPAAISGNFWDVTTSGRSTSAAGHGMTTAQMQTEANFTSATTANGGTNPNWDFTSIWFLPSGSYPKLVSFAD